MSKAIFRWDANGYFCSSDVKPDDYQLKENETFDEPKFNDPSNALTPYKRVAGGWQASNQEEHDAYIKKQQDAYYAAHPEAKPQPAQATDQDRINAQLMLANANQAKINAQLMKGLAALQADAKANTTTNGGN